MHSNAADGHVRSGLSRAVVFQKGGGEVLKFVAMNAIRILLPEQLSDSILKMNYDVKVMIIFHPSKYFKQNSFEKSTPVFLIFGKTPYIGVVQPFFTLLKRFF